MKDWKKSPTSSKEKAAVTAKKKDEGVTNPNETESLAGQLGKKEEKGEDVMGMEEDFKLFMKEQEKFNKNLGTFVEGLTKREEQQVQGTRIQEQIKTATAPMEVKIEQQGKVLKKLQKQLEPFGEVCSSVEECQKKLNELEKAPSEEEPEEKTLDKYSAQEKYDSIKNAPSALGDLDNIYADRFAEDPEYRKLALEKLSDDVFVELAKEKAIETKLTALCNDEVCRADVVGKIKEVEKSTGKKLL